MHFEPSLMGAVDAYELPDLRSQESVGVVGTFPVVVDAVAAAADQDVLVASDVAVDDLCTRVFPVNLAAVARLCLTFLVSQIYFHDSFQSFVAAGLPKIADQVEIDADCSVAMVHLIHMDFVIVSVIATLH